MKTAFTLDELLYAQRVIFPGDFERLWMKYSQDEKEAQYMAFLYRVQYKSNLFEFIREYAMGDKEYTDIFTKMISDVLE